MKRKKMEVPAAQVIFKMGEEREPNTMKEVKENTTSLENLARKMNSVLPSFKSHTFVKKQAAQFFEENKPNLQKGKAVIQLFKHLGRSIVTDNIGNVRKMCSDLEENEDLNVIICGCSAHLLNLLAKDLQVPNVKEHVEIVKYFCKNHFAHAKYKQEGGQLLVLPKDVRWNTIADCLPAYIKYWLVLTKICEENRTAINENIYRKAMNMGIKRNADHMLRHLKPVAIALDTVQKDSCTISTAVDMWKRLRQSLEDENLDEDSMKKFDSHYHQALGEAHFLVYLMDPWYCGPANE
ncbi:hypothetical protein PR048_025348 [Dryococelus australis]|uniref:DUF659 domain-containing protein n=1 Tax=Dryococelus australis TaxID=614101 RepID=A0ABQ9GR39_9NEOP|nr:hypothetical protein PR048_025348 [Dryococelus australis]